MLNFFQCFYEKGPFSVETLKFLYIMYYQPKVQKNLDTGSSLFGYNLTALDFLALHHKEEIEIVSK
jgi:hypothetical protein